MRYVLLFCIERIFCSVFPYISVLPYVALCFDVLRRAAVLHCVWLHYFLTFRMGTTRNTRYAVTTVTMKLGITTTISSSKSILTLKASKGPWQSATRTTLHKIHSLKYYTKMINALFGSSAFGCVLLNTWRFYLHFLLWFFGWTNEKEKTPACASPRNSCARHSLVATWRGSSASRALERALMAVTSCFRW